MSDRRGGTEEEEQGDTVLGAGPSAKHVMGGRALDILEVLRSPLWVKWLRREKLGDCTNLGEERTKTYCSQTENRCRIQVQLLAAQKPILDRQRMVGKESLLSSGSWQPGKVVG